MESTNILQDDVETNTTIDTINAEIKPFKKRTIKKASKIVIKTKLKNVQNLVNNTISTDVNTLDVLIDEINKLTLSNTKEFSFDGTITYCKVLRIHDADTLTVGFKYNGNYYKKNLRLNNIDAPELHSKNGDEALACRLGRNYLSSLIMDKVITTHMGGLDKYGRILSDIYTLDDNVHLNELMIQKKYVRKYSSDDLHKGPWTKEETDAVIEQAKLDGIED